MTLILKSNFTWQIGDVIRLSVVDGADGFPVLTATQNGFTIMQVQDQNSNPLLTGNPAMQVNASTVANATSALWAGGNVASYNVIFGNARTGNVTINFTGTATGSVVTDSSGNYSIDGLSAGSYTITPSRQLCFFSLECK